MKYSRKVYIENDDLGIDEDYLDIPSMQLIGLLELRYGIRSYSKLADAIGVDRSYISRAVTKTTGLKRDNKKSKMTIIIEKF